MYYMFTTNMSYWILIIVCLILGVSTQGYIESMYKKWSMRPVSNGKTGADVAREMLLSQGVGDVQIKRTAGHLTDHYDPRDNSLYLSDDNFSGGSVASIAVACHEAGHALQAAKAYVPYRLRTAIAPVVSFASNIWMFVCIAGIFFNMVGLIQIGIVCFAAIVVFQLVTLPVEINASRRAVAYVSQAVGEEGKQGAKQVLTAAALTYVAATLTSILQLAYLLSQQDRNR